MTSLGRTLGIFYQILL